MSDLSILIFSFLFHLTNDISTQKLQHIPIVTQQRLPVHIIGSMKNASRHYQPIETQPLVQLTSLSPTTSFEVPRVAER